MNKTTVICRIDGVPVIACSEIKDGARHAPAGARLLRFFCIHCNKFHFHNLNPVGKLTRRAASCPEGSPLYETGYYVICAKAKRPLKTLDLFSDLKFVNMKK